MEFEPCGNPVYAQRADHRPTLTAKQQGTIKEQDLVHYPFGEGSRGDLASPFDEHMLDPTPPQHLQQRPQWDTALVSGQAEDLNPLLLEEAPLLALPALGRSHYQSGRG